MSTKRLPVLIAAVLAGLLGLQMVFVAIQAQSAERDEKVVHALLRTHQILINPMFMSNALLDLSSAGFMKCVKLIRRDNQQ